jgi:hypothetical protein
MGSMIRSAPLGVFLAMVGIFVLMAGVAVFAGWRARQRGALVAATPKSNIGMAEDGYRQFEGTAEAIAGMSVVAPLTNSPCLWYHAKVEEWTRMLDRDSSTRKWDWATIKEVASEAPFVLRDATGSCVVYPYDAEATPTDKSLWYGATSDPEDRNPARVGPGEAAKPMVEVSGGPNSKYRYSEERIYAGNPLTVQGRFASEFAVPAADPDVDPADVDDEPDLTDVEEKAHAAARTKASIRYTAGGEPFLISTLSREKHAETMALAGKGALGIAVFPLAIAALIVWLRFS